MSGIGHNGGPGFDDDEHASRSPYGRDGFISLGRATRDHDIVGIKKPVEPANKYEGSCSRFEAWIDLIMECRYKDGTVTTKTGQEMTLRRGQVLGAVSWLAARWNWTPKTVRGFLDDLEAAEMIVRVAEMNNAQNSDDPSSPKGNQKGDQQGNHEGNQKRTFKGNRPSVLSVCNYDTYQSSVVNKGQPLEDGSGQPKGQPAGQPEGQHLNKELNKGINNTNPPTPLAGGGDDFALQAEASAMEASAAEAVKPAEPAKPKRKGGRQAKPRTTIDQNWAMPREWWIWANDTYVIERDQLIKEAIAFHNKALSNNLEYADWFAAWRNWIGAHWKKYQLRDLSSVPVADLSLLDAKPEPEFDRHADEIAKARAMMREDDDD